MQTSLRQANSNEPAESNRNASNRVDRGQGEKEKVSVRVETCVVEEFVEEFNDNSRYSSSTRVKEPKTYDKIPSLVLNDIEAVGQDDDAVDSDLKRLRNKIEVVAMYDEQTSARTNDDYEVLNTSNECDPLTVDDRRDLAPPHQVKSNGKNDKQARKGAAQEHVKHSTGNRLSLNCFNSPKTAKKSKPNAPTRPIVNNHVVANQLGNKGNAEQGQFQRTAKKEEIEVTAEFDEDFYESSESKCDPRKSSNGGNAITDHALSPLRIVPSVTSISTTTHSLNNHNNNSNNLNKFLRNLTRHLRSNNCLW